MRRRTPTAMVPRSLLAAIACAAVLAACGSSASTPARPPSTVTRTVTRSASATSSATSSSATAATSSTRSTTSSTSTQATSAAASVPECVAADLALGSLGGSGATGHELLAFSLRNSSDRTCRTGGYPGVLFLNAAGRGLPTDPDHTTEDFFGHTALRVLAVAPGQTVSFRLGVTDVSSGDSSSGCERARGLQVIAPNDTATLRVDRDIDECGGRVTVSPLQVGTSALR